MKKFIQWLAKVFNANITETKTVTKEVIKTEYVTSGVIDGDVYVKGNLCATGYIMAEGGITANCKEE